MSILIDDERLNTRAKSVNVTSSTLTVELEDGRSVSTPLAWYPRLENGTMKERRNFEIGHFGIHWPDLDEDLSIRGLLLGHQSGENSNSLQRWLETRKKGKLVKVTSVPLPKWATVKSKELTKI